MKLLGWHKSFEIFFGVGTVTEIGRDGNIKIALGDKIGIEDHKTDSQERDHLVVQCFDIYS